jgi:uncharacterized protein (TIGR02246 family)
MTRFDRMGVRGYASATAILLALMAWPSAGWSKDVACVDVTENDIAALFARWNAALQTLNPDIVADNYAPYATLLPTVEDGPLVTREEIVAYFKIFLKKKPVGAINERIIRIGCNIASDIGLYTFTYGAPERPPDTPARYTFVYEFDGRRWLIAHHHSSKRPE